MSTASAPRYSQSRTTTIDASVPYLLLYREKFAV